jgi:hypothetical protein
LIRRIVYLVIAFVALTASAAQSYDWSQYKPTTVAAALSRTRVIKGNDYTVELDNIKYVVEAVYSGEHREMGVKRRELLRQWVEVPGHAKQDAEQDVQFRAGAQLIWVSLQNGLLKPFTEEAKAGSKLRLYVTYIGADGEDRVFVVNRFEVSAR